MSSFTGSVHAVRGVQSIKKAVNRQNTGFDDWRFVLHRKYFDASLRASAHTGVAIRSPKKLATQGVLTYFTTRSCCGARQNVCPTERTHILPTAATRSGRFIRHWRRSHRSPRRCHCEPARRLVWQSASPAAEGGAVLCTARKRIPTPVCATSRNDTVVAGLCNAKR